MSEVLLSVASVRGAAVAGVRVPIAVALCVGLLLVGGVLVPGLASAAPSPSDDCPNAAIRAMQHATFLPGCRAYEMVSPVAKNSADINPQNTVQVSPDGERALFSAPMGFPDGPTSTIQNYFLGERTSAVWLTEGIEPPQYNPAQYNFYTSVATSSDLSRTVQVSRRALAPGAVEGGGNIYLRDNRTGARTLVATGPASLLEGFSGAGAFPPIGGGTRDFSRFVFDSDAKLTDDAIGGVPNAYEYSVTSGLRLVSVLPDGSADPAGSSGRLQALVKSRGPVSEDGRRMVFSSNTTGGGLYLREGDVTTPISVSQRVGDPDTPQPAGTMAISADGTQVFFTSASPLTDDSTAQSPELYRYDVASGRLFDLTVASNPADSSGAFLTRVLSVSDRGDHVYFLAYANLVPGGVTGGVNLYEWSPTGIRFIAELDGSEYSGVGSWATSANGRILAFSSIASLTDFDSRSLACSEAPDSRCSEVFVYDSDAQRITCASCTPGTTPSGHSMIGGQQATVSNHYGRAVMDSGTVFFETPNKLVGGDTNGRGDVYEWDGSANRLISSGQGESDATFADASVDGSSVFFTTAQSLVGQDIDSNIDLYAARVDGGLAGQNIVPGLGLGCVEDECQGRVSPSPGPMLAGSVTFLGSGNVLPALGSPPAKSARPKVTTPKAVTGTSVRLKVKVPGRGRIGVTGRGLAASSKTVAKAGSYQVVVRLSGRARQTLKRKHRLMVRVAVRFVPSEGKAQSVGVSVTFKTVTSRKGRS